MNRTIIATVIGFLSGLLCLYGTMMAINKGELDIQEITMVSMALILFNRTLIGFVVGLSDIIKINYILRGAIIGALISLMIAIFPLISGDTANALTFIGFGLVYGIIIDVVSTSFSKQETHNQRKHR